MISAITAIIRRVRENSQAVHSAAPLMRQDHKSWGFNMKKIKRTITQWCNELHLDIVDLKGFNVAEAIHRKKISRDTFERKLEKCVVVLKDE